MKSFISIMILIALSFLSCKNSINILDSKPSKLSDSNKSVEAFKYDIIISFISKGAGIDIKLKKEIDNSIDFFNKKNNTKIAPEIIAWGREGEKDYLFITKNLSTKKKKEFIASMKEIVGNTALAHISFDQVAVHKR